MLDHVAYADASHARLVPSQLLAAFTKFDVDQSGYLDNAEIRKALQTVKLDMESDAAQGLLKKYDADQSGKMEFEEFVLLCTALEAVTLDLTASVTTAETLKAAQSSKCPSNPHVTQLLSTAHLYIPNCSSCEAQEPLRAYQRGALRRWERCGEYVEGGDWRSD